MLGVQKACGSRLRQILSRADINTNSWTALQQWQGSIDEPTTKSIGAHRGLLIAAQRSEIRELPRVRGGVRAVSSATWTR